MKIAIIYHSESGNNKTLADYIIAGASKVEGVEAKAFSITDVDADYVKASQCIILGAPIYMATVSHQMKTWLDTEFGKVGGAAGKLVGAYASAQYVHGGGDLGIRMMLDHSMVMGGMVYSGGGSCGAPVIHLGPVAIATAGNTEALEGYKDTFEVYGERMANQAKKIFG